MSSALVLQYATTAALGVLIVAVILTIVRVIRGPTLADRILALDMFTTLAMGFIAAVAILTGFSLYLDIAISLGLIGFLSTIALARYLFRRSELDAPSGETME